MPSAGAVILAVFAATSSSALDRVGPFTLEADRLSAEFGLDVYVAEGNVILRRGDLTVTADKIALDQRLDTVIAEGHVVLIEGNAILSCDRVALLIPDLKGVIEGAEIRIVDGARTTSRLTAERIERTGEHRFTLDGASFTPCRCGEDEAPSWKIEASSASVNVESGAWLLAPVFYAKNVPVLILPAIYVPLGDRRSGVLLPRGKRTSTQGLAATLPFYLTLGRSWDTTVEASYWTSRGPAPGLELRWFPARHSRGNLHASLLFDFGDLDAEGWSTTRSDPLFRYAIAGEHQTHLENSDLAAELNLVGDPAYPREFADAFLQRQAEESVSRATYSTHASRAVRAAVGLALRQDLRLDKYAGLPPEELREVSIFDHPLSSDVLYRAAEVRLDMAPQPYLDGAPWVLGDARFVLHAFGTPNLERVRMARVDFRPAISLFFAPSGLGSFETSAALRLTAWSGAVLDDSITEGRVAPVIRSRLGTLLSRRFGDLEHRIRPSLHHLMIPGIAGEAPNNFFLGDEIDRFRRAHQVAAELETDLWSFDRGRLFGLRARIGRELETFERLGFETSELLVEADVDLTFGPQVRARLSGETAVSLDPGQVRELVARTDLFFGSALDLSFSWGQFAGTVPRYFFTGSEELVPSYASDYEEHAEVWRRFRGLAASAVFRPIAALIFSFAIGADVLSEVEDPLRYVEGGVSWTSPCECWSAALRVGKSRDRPGIDVSIALDLAQLGAEDLARRTP